MATLVQSFPMDAQCMPMCVLKVEKGDPKRRMALFLGKTESQDAGVVGDGEQVMLTTKRPFSVSKTKQTSFMPDLLLAHLGVLELSP